MQPVPTLNSQEIEKGFQLAENSSRKRHPLIVHQKGDYFNKVFNFLLKGTYMKPHRHVGLEKIEKMTLIYGSFTLFYFNDNGQIIDQHNLEIGKKEYIEVPNKIWHTYVMESEKVLIYETMEGVYDPNSWKELASWAPEENDPNSNDYISSLRKNRV